MSKRPEDFDEALCLAVAHAMNFHGLDAKLGMADYAIAELIIPEISRHLRGETDVQVYERMTSAGKRGIADER